MFVQLLDNDDTKTVAVVITLYICVYVMYVFVRYIGVYLICMCYVFGQDMIFN
jgi:hypothetical protein